MQIGKKTVYMTPENKLRDETTTTQSNIDTTKTGQVRKFDDIDNGERKS